ncbi:hypothetical protein ACWCQW_47365 [Streptomyces mirabilis]
MTRTTKTIKAELRAERGKEHPDKGRLSELMAELRRARHRREEVSGEDSADSGRRIGPDEVDRDAERIKTWPSHLRAKISRSPYSRVIDGRPVDDPGAHGRRSDLRRWSPWR